MKNQLYEKWEIGGYVFKVNEHSDGHFELLYRHKLMPGGSWLKKITTFKNGETSDQFESAGEARIMILNALSEFLAN